MSIHAPQNVDYVRLLNDLRAQFATGGTRTLRWRLAQLRGIERMCEEEESEIIEALSVDLGRTKAEALFGDITATKSEAAFAYKRVKRWMRPDRVSVPLTQLPSRAWIQHDPLGVVLVIGPWNYPFYLTMAPVVAAVAAGNGVVIKPSELAPAISALLMKLVPRYLDETAVRVVEGDAQTTQALLALGFDHALFTGGTEVGRKIMAAAASTLTPVTLELGGKSPAIVAADADLDVAARRLANTKLANSGQTCIAPDYILAEASIAPQLVTKIVAYMDTFKTAAALPIVNERQFDRIAAMVATTTGSVVSGGGVDRLTLRIEPTVVVDPSPSDLLMQSEIFGPVLPIITVQSIDAAVDFINARPKPLALYVFSNSRRLSRGLIDRTSSGGAVINHAIMHCLVPQLPFGGVGASGMGAYHGKWGFDTFSHRRAILAKPAKPDFRMVYPPYTDRTIAVMRRLF